MKISGVLLAAGSSMRMGTTNKLLLEYNNHTIIEEVISQLIDSKLEELLVVTGFESEEIINLVEKYKSEKVSCCLNKNYKQGRASSIRCAVNYFQKNLNAFLFMVADKPMVKSSLINKAIDTFIEKQPDILYVQTPSGRGHPIIFSKKLFTELLELEGDLTGNNLKEKYNSSTVVIKNNASQQDIDTYEDYLSLINLGK